MGRGRAANIIPRPAGPRNKLSRQQKATIRIRSDTAALLVERYASHSSVARAPRSCNEASADR
jgi:hypothetical protein